MRDAVFGAKVALLSGGRVLTILRDDIPTIPYPGHWDLPGGAAEPGETGRDCARRELDEELGLDLPRRIDREGRYRDSRGRRVAFLLVRCHGLDPRRIVWGEEGQGWALVPLARWLSMPGVIPAQRRMLRAALRSPAGRAPS